ncbi:MAG TPA: efflux RND transporter periplasmic adaptor subunit, partial [Bryobacteraceae bacterium]|nr:efflux RND transporter periplasmic adaptor subunit [Bryobacteraceae bacterium]
VTRDRAQLRQAEAALARDTAQSKNAQAEADRYAELAKAGIISRAQQDQVRTSAEVTRESVRAAQAAIESAKASLESDLAAVDRAKLDISYCRILAPISGRTGNVLVDPGNLVRANDAPLVVIHRISPVFVSFSVPEQHLSAIRALSASRRLEVRVSPQEAPDRPLIGQLSLVDNSVDTTTGTIRLKATLPNTDAALWPGQFVNAILTLDTTKDASVVPLEAVQSGPKGSYVYVVQPNKTVENRVIVAGRSFARRIIINSGLKPGETVVIDGHLRLAPGARVRVVDPSTLEGKKS